MAERNLKSLTFDDIPGVKYVLDSGNVNYDEDETYSSGSVGKAVSALKEDLTQNYAKNDGYYEDMTVGDAEQLVATTFEEDNKPYLFRTSGGSIDIGDREFDTIVGGTLAWNQLVQNGNFASTDGWTGAGNISISASGNVLTATIGDSVGSMYHGVRKTTNFDSSTNGHKFLITADINAPYSGAGIGVVNSTAASNQFTGVANTWSTVRTLLNFETGDHQLQIYVGANYASYSANDTFMVRNCMCIDLTAMFGSTIADYIYTLETTTAGAGVAFFRKLFPKPYYAYNAGELMSVNASAHNTVGFNALDRNNLHQFSDNSVRTINNIPVVGGQTYELCCDSLVLGTAGRAAYVAEVDAEGNETAHASYNSPFTSLIVTMNSNTVAVRLDFYSTTGMPLSRVLDSDPCLHLVWDGERNGEYEAYVKHSYPLDSDLVLRGIPKLDASNNLYYDGDAYASDGTVTRKYGIVDLGTLNYTYNPSYGFITQGLSSVIKNASGYTENGNLICSKYITYNYNDITAGTTDKCIGVSGGNYGYVVISDSLYTNAETFKTAMSGVYLVYELAEPTTEQAEPYTNPQIVDDFGTEEYVTTSIVPVGHITKYQANLRAKLEMAPNSPDGDGDYIVRQTSGVNEYVELIIPTELPTLPTEDGTYTLKCQVASGTPTKVWVADE